LIAFGILNHCLVFDNSLMSISSPNSRSHLDSCIIIPARLTLIYSLSFNVSIWVLMPFGQFGFAFISLIQDRRFQNFNMWCRFCILGILFLLCLLTHLDKTFFPSLLWHVKTWIFKSI
jgi:hypothetical protein